jgi:pimeloyl-ACP methyl ester carboxylesterase
MSDPRNSPEQTQPRRAKVLRGFVEIDEGQAHFREAGRSSQRMGNSLPLVMLHASPGSAKMLESLILQLSLSRHVIAPDTLGNGDSCAPAEAAPSISYFANAHLRVLDTLGIERFDLYGSHTGANIACEIAIEHPRRVRRLILDGISLYTADERADMLAHYAPKVAIDQSGSQFHWISQFVRDTFLFWPWYRKQVENRRPIGLPSADDLHDKTVEVIKAARTYHIAYRAAIAYDKTVRLPLVRVPTLLTCATNDMFMAYFERVQQLIPAATPVITRGYGSPESLAETCAIFDVFLDRDSS